MFQKQKKNAKECLNRSIVICTRTQIAIDRAFREFANNLKLGIQETFSLAIRILNRLKTGINEKRDRGFSLPSHISAWYLLTRINHYLFGYCYQKVNRKLKIFKIFTTTHNFSLTKFTA